MRLPKLFASVALGLLALHSSPARASGPQTDDDESIGTRPAFGSQPTAAPAPMDRARTQAEEPPPGVAPSGAARMTLDVEERASDRDRSYRSSRAPIATDPPPDWAVVHAGLRPQLGTFGGLATFALAHARTERFYGAFSLSAVRNDAGTHIGAAQIALGRNLADELIGGVQVSLTENRARTFTGIGQTGIVYNRAGEMTGALQLSAFNRAKTFTGGLQLGGYNRTDESFSGLAALGGFNHSRRNFTGAFQLGAVNGVGRMFSESGDASNTRFAGIAQVGLANSASNFYGLAQIGIGNVVVGDYRGVVQIGVVGAAAKHFKGLAQIGAFTMSERSLGLQIGGGSVSLEEHEGLQLGALGNYARSIAGAQLGLINIADEVKGVQIGLVNHTRRLRGLQIGLANHAEDGVLPWTSILNFGFGDDDSGDEPDGRDYVSAAR